jgi:transcription antitermination factor NusG
MSWWERVPWWGEKHWYAIQTKSCQETMAAEQLRRHGVEVFFPKRRQRRLMWGIEREEVRPLFPGYLFGRFCLAEKYRAVRWALGVKDLVRSGEVPVPVDERIIGMIRERMDTEGIVWIGPKVGDEVEIVEGPLRGLRGVLEAEVGDRERVIVLLQAIAYQARVMIERRALRPKEGVVW